MSFGICLLISGGIVILLFLIALFVEWWQDATMPVKTVLMVLAMAVILAVLMFLLTGEMRT